MAYTVKAVAELAGVSVRTLHHYDAIGLLQPAQKSAAGYRLYADRDLERLQQILFFRELGFDLHRIREILDSPNFDRRLALREHRRLLLEKQERLARLIRSVDRTLEAMERRTTMDPKEMFDGFDPAEYEEEARRRWGHTQAYRESKERTQRYTKADWQAILQEQKEIEQALASLLGNDPTDAQVQKWIDRHYQQINDRFYSCSPQMYRGLGDLYVQDPRFKAHYDEIKPGLAEFVRAAIHAYCDRREGQH